MIANVDFNKRRGSKDRDLLLDDKLYKERYSIERTNAWMDSFRSLLNRFDVTITSWKGFNFLAFIVLELRKFTQKHNSDEFNKKLRTFAAILKYYSRT